MLPLAFGWRHLLFANYPLDPERVDRCLPDALSVQTFDGRAWLSVVAFVNVDTRPRGLPAALGVDLPELNLRTYVTRDGEQGVYFFSLDAGGLVGLPATVGARLTHHLPYYTARMRVRTDGDRVHFASRRRHPGARPARYRVRYGPTGEPFTAEAGSLAEFLTERRRLYALDQRGRLRHTDVDHPRWTLYEAEQSVDENGLFAANGFDHPNADPTLYYSPGVDVTTTRSQRWAE